MSDEITLTVSGHADIDAVEQFLTESSQRPASTVFEHSDLDCHFRTIGFQDPYDRRRYRELRTLRSEKVDQELRENIGTGDYTRLVLVNKDNAEKIMRSLAEKLGGVLANEDVVIEVFDAPANQSPIV